MYRETLRKTNLNLLIPGMLTANLVVEYFYIRNHGKSLKYKGTIDFIQPDYFGVEKKKVYIRIGISWNGLVIEI